MREIVGIGWVRLVARLVVAGGIGLVSAAGASASLVPAQTRIVAAGGMRAVVHERPWSVRFTDASGAPILTEVRGGVFSSAAGALGFSSAGRWFHATRAIGGYVDAGSYVARLRTDDPRGRTIAVRISLSGDSVLSVSARGPGDAAQMGLGFNRPPGERFSGFGERSDAVIRSGGTVRDYVAEGPYQPAEQRLIAGFVPAAGYDPRPDASYFPIPWLLSSRGYGFLLVGNEQSKFTLGSPWSVTIDGRQLDYRIYAGPRPAQALRRFTEDVGRQPPVATPFYFGPWWQPHGDPLANVRLLRQAGGGALGSLVQTYTHYLPCASQRGRAAEEQQTTEAFHRSGLAVTTYFNPMMCTGYHPRYDQAVQKGLLTKNSLGQTYDYRYTGTSQFLVGQFDFTAPGATPFYGALLAEAVGNGYDGWMEDFGEYTPTDSVSADHSRGTSMHNLYPVLYHRAGYAYAKHAPRPLARFSRSGWTGAARFSQLVWGGDPTTWFGFDGLRSAIANGLSMGASGVSLWGSDIGGYFALSLPQTTPDLERRWIEFGFASGVMRTEANGFSLATARRAQIFDPQVLPVWVRYARLRTQLEPYLAAAERIYDRTGMPLMRQLMLAYPSDDRASTRDDEYLLGPDLLVAPVIEPGAVSRALYLPPGRWVDLWRSVQIGRDGAPRLRVPAVFAGGREVTVPAPGDQLPIFVRAGASLGLLPADVQTLSSYGSGVVHLRDRADERSLIAWPRRGLPSTTASLADDGTVHSAMSAAGEWVLRVDQAQARKLELQVALATPPCRLYVNGHARRFRYAAGVMSTVVHLRSGNILASPRCDRPGPRLRLRSARKHRAANAAFVIGANHSGGDSERRRDG